MGLEFTEHYLFITMGEPRLGDKRYDVATGVVHQLQTYSLKDTRQANIQSTSQGQNSVPYLILMGKKPDTVIIEVRMGNLADVKARMDSFATYGTRIYNLTNPKNLFLVGTVLTVTTNNSHWELPIASNWFVESWEISRSVQNRNFTGTLGLLRWYQDLTNINYSDPAMV